MFKTLEYCMAGSFWKTTCQPDPGRFCPHSLPLMSQGLAPLQSAQSEKGASSCRPSRSAVRELYRTLCRAQQCLTEWQLSLRQTAAIYAALVRFMLSHPASGWPSSSTISMLAGLESLLATLTAMLPLMAVGWLIMQPQEQAWSCNHLCSQQSQLLDRK